MRRAAIIALVLMILCPASGWAQDTGADAFERDDLPAARVLWQQEAAAGSADAMLSLGLLADRGFGGVRDPSAAFDWYAQAADLGLAEAQFNLAIIYDAGTDRPRDVTQAILWYTRAALRDHARAQFNLGLLYEAGDGIAANPALASYWFDKAAEVIPAAGTKTLLPQADTDLTAPAMLFANGDEAVWTVDGAAFPAFLVEAVEVPGLMQDYLPAVVSLRTSGSGLLADETLNEDTLWRVSSVTADNTEYAASDWVGANSVTLPKGRIRLIFDPSSPTMQDAAHTFAADLRYAGYWVRLDARPPQDDDSYISFGFVTDQQLAATLAAYLPTLTDVTPVKQSLNTTAPGEIIVNLGAYR